MPKHFPLIGSPLTSSPLISSTLIGSTLVAPNELPLDRAKANSPPFIWDAVHRTVIKFVEPLACQPAIASPNHAETVVHAMQRLVAIINTLRSAQPSFLERTSKHWLSDTQTLEALLPYVSEEAYDVLEAMESGRQNAFSDFTSPLASSAPPTPHTPHPTPHTVRLSAHAEAPHPLTTIDTLIPSLLWSLARSDYSTMQLIEGVRVRCWQPEQGWAIGMLRLVVMLQAETPMTRWCFDVATGYPAENVLEPTAIVHSDECMLPIRPIAAEDSLSASACQVDRQLAAIVQSLDLNQSGLKPLVQGVAGKLLQPGSDWQAGKLQLRLGFEFSPQSNATVNHPNTRLPELIDAELMDDTSGITQNPSPSLATPFARTIAGLMTQPQVSVVNPVGRSLSPTTLVRVTDADRLEDYTQLITQQQCAQCLDQLMHQRTSSDDENTQLMQIVQTAIACERQLRIHDIGLSQPLLLMDELVPKLLWSLTSSTYEIMELLGGIPAQVLQPHADWQQGTLRLLAALHLKAAATGDRLMDDRLMDDRLMDDRLDLSTGRSVLTNTTGLGLDAIAQTSTPLCAQPTAIATLTAYLQQQLDAAMPAYKLLRESVAIAWLEDVEQDWQTGSMQLSLSLAFVADAR